MPITQTEAVANGAVIVENIIDVTEGYAYDSDKAIQRMFRDRAPELLQTVHTARLDYQNDTTIHSLRYSKIFNSPAEMNMYVVEAVQALYNDFNNQMLEKTKDLLVGLVDSGAIPSIDLGVAATPAEFQTALLAHSAQMETEASRDYNNARAILLGDMNKKGAMLQANRANLRFILTNKTHALLGVDFFSNRFHLDPVQTDLAVKRINYFTTMAEVTANHTVVQADFDQGFLSPENFQVGDIIEAGVHVRVPVRMDFATGDYVYNVPSWATVSTDGSKILGIVFDRRALVLNPVYPEEIGLESTARGRKVNVVLNAVYYTSASILHSGFALTGTVVPTP